MQALDYGRMYGGSEHLILFGSRNSHKSGKGGKGVANQVGKRYQCKTCNTEMIVTKAGSGALGCCGQPMQQKQ